MGGQGCYWDEILMALNLIKVQTAKGPIFIGVGQIAQVLQTELGSRIILADGTSVETAATAQSIFDLANRRPPDGN